MGTSQLLEILTRITQGRGKIEDLDVMKDLGETIIKTSLCGLGQTAPKPALSTLKFFLKEYEDHILEKRCDGATCDSMVISACQHACPAKLKRAQTVNVGLGQPTVILLDHQGDLALRQCIKQARCFCVDFQVGAGVKVCFHRRACPQSPSNCSVACCSCSSIIVTPYTTASTGRVRRKIQSSRLGQDRVGGLT